MAEVGTHYFFFCPLSASLLVQNFSYILPFRKNVVWPVWVRMCVPAQNWSKKTSWEILSVLITSSKFRTKMNFSVFYGNGNLLIFFTQNSVCAISSKNLGVFIFVNISQVQYFRAKAFIATLNNFYDENYVWPSSKFLFGFSKFPSEFHK